MTTNDVVNALHAIKAAVRDLVDELRLLREELRAERLRRAGTGGPG